MNKLAFFLFFLSAVKGFSQKSLTISEAEQALQKHNLFLLAEYCNVSASQAAVIQAKIWEQPYVSAELNAFNPETNHFFDIGPQGQKAVAVEQLIYLGGKKKNEIAYAKSNAALAELQFEQLLRTLRLELAQNFYTVYFEQQKVRLLETQIVKLDTLVKTYQEQADKGNIPLKEVVRLQTLSLSLKNDKNTSQKEIIEDQERLKLLTGTDENIQPLVKDEETNRFNLPKTTKEELLKTAPVNNPEYLAASKISESQELFLKWQRSLSVPDITTGVSYDQRSGAFQNQVNLTLGIPLPLWNKNKGNIKIAESQLSAANMNRDYKKAELENRISSAWDVWNQQREQIFMTDKSVGYNLEAVYKGIINNFQKRNITLIEFTDFMESYNQTTLQLNEMKKQLILAGINLNYVTNTEVF